MKPIDYPINKPIDLPAVGGWPDSVHVLDGATALALQAAEVTGRPLLLQGEAGLGKSQTARAAAAAASPQRPFLATVITHRTEAQDLLWTMDMVKRLGDAQLNVRGSEDQVGREDAYITPGPLWWAFNWPSAAVHVETHQATLRIKQLCPFKDGGAQQGWNPAQDRVVLLIDEIDKADPDLPNALLEVLGNGGFDAPAGLPAVTCAGPSAKPLVIITTNNERDLPAPFLRRCLVHTLKLPDNLVPHLVELAQQHADFWAQRAPAAQHRPHQCQILEEAAKEVAKERDRLRGSDAYKPGTSEYLDLVNALGGLWPGDREQQLQRLAEVARFTLQKQG